MSEPKYHRVLLKISETAERTAKTILKLQKKNERSQLV